MMRAISRISKILMWIIFVIYVIIQAVTACILQFVNNPHAIAAGKTEKVFNVIPLVSATLLMIAAVILFTVLKKKRYIGLILAVAASVIIFIIALALEKFNPYIVSTTEINTGLNTLKLIVRHIGIAMVPVLMLPAWLCERAADKKDPSSDGESRYNLSGGAVFTDVDDNGLATDHNEPPRRMKRSVRKKSEK